jgi:hypothetical protein
MGRRSKLTDAIVERLADGLGAGCSLEQAAKSAGVTSRSLRRWRAQGRDQLDELGLPARLELALERAQLVVALELDDPWQLTLEAAAANRAELVDAAGQE